MEGRFLSAQAPSRIVGIGASAGGIEAFQGFFRHMPAGHGLSFVVVLHLAPDRFSMLAEIIGHWTTMAVEPAVDGATLQADHVYVTQPNCILTIERGRLRVRAAATPRETLPIDVFFNALAAEVGRDAVGIVLSGTGYDGAMGLKAIHEAGGLTLAQGRDGSAPHYAGMPNAAVATGAVAFILPVEAMPKHIIGLREPSEGAGGSNAAATASESEAGSEAGTETGARPETGQQSEPGAVRLQVCTVLHAHTETLSGGVGASLRV